MDCGIESGNYGVISDPDFRFELYQDWKSILSQYPNYDPRRFCKNKGIKFEALGELVREFESYDPTGKRWG